jgi:hypothetical protein
MQSAYCVLLFMVHAENEDGQVGRFIQNVSYQIDAVTPWHRYVQHQQAPAGSPDMLHDFNPIGSFSGHQQILCVVQNLSNTVPNDGVVIGQQNSYFVHPCLCAFSAGSITSICVPQPIAESQQSCRQAVWRVHRMPIRPKPSRIST